MWGLFCVLDAFTGWKLDFLFIYLLAVQHGIWDLSSQFVVQSLSRV